MESSIVKTHVAITRFNNDQHLANLVSSIFPFFFLLPGYFEGNPRHLIISGSFFITP